MDQLSRSTLDIINKDNSDYRPSFVFYHLISQDQKTLNSMLADLPLLTQTLSYIHTSIAIFIDKTDQAFSHHIYKIQGNSDSTVGARNASIWQYSQLSLANAAYDIFSSTNQHIKVYFTIRQEALLDAEDIAPNVFRNFSSYITTIDYSKSDLYNMFSLYVSKENDNNLRIPNLKYKNPEKAFVGFDTLQHGYVENNEVKHEKFFDYIYRHSMGRASDIQQICRDLYMKNVSTLDEDISKHYINESARTIVKQYIAELSPISLMPKGSINELLSGITTNVFDIEYMKEICRRYMVKRGINDSCKMDCFNCDALNPFASLFNLGLLGYLYTNQSSEETYEQRFISAKNRIITGDTIDIEKSIIYLLHPTISDLASAIRRSSRRNYSNSTKLIVGNTITCSKDTVLQIIEDLKHKKAELKNELVFVSSTMKTLTDMRKMVAESIEKKGYYPLICENPDYSIDTHVFSHDDCIDKILQCGNFITIFDKSYGGKYCGEKYKKYAEEIVKKSEGKILEPSITLMEYYVARKKRKKFLVLMNNSIVEHSTTKEYLSSRRKKWQNKKDIDKMVIIMNFINKLKLTKSDTVPNGNMMKFYSNYFEIKEFISDHSFN